jgi:ketosteroid isomerase-like protein
MAIDTERTRQIATNWYAAMGSGDGDTIMGTLAEDVLVKLGDKPWTKPIPYLGTWHGRAEFGKAVGIRMGTAEITAYEPRAIVCDGNKVAALLYSKAIANESKKEFELEVVHFLELNDDGKIAKLTAYFDPVPEIDAFAPGSVKLA